jgi:hypothetical protein
MRIAGLRALMPLRRADDFDRFTEGLSKAGLPE